jgi:predicted aspartyl protease
MITGTVNTDREATIHLLVRDLHGREWEIVAVLDTGFSGSLTLLPANITAFGLPWRSRARVVLANGSEDECDIYAATII